MSKFLFTGWPYPGCLNPQMAVAHALRARGHAVAFYNGTRSHDLIMEEGFIHFSFGKPLNEQIESLLLSPSGIGKGWQSIWRIKAMLRAFLFNTVPKQIADLDAVLAEWQPDVVVCEPAMLGPFLILHEARQIPVALLEYAACMLPGPDISHPGLGLPPPRNWHTRLRARLGGAIIDLVAKNMRLYASKLRRRYGLPALESSVMALRRQLPLVLVPSCPEFDYQRHDLPPSVQYVGPCLWYPAQEPSSWLTKLPRDRPWVHVSEGTLYAESPVVLRAAAQGLADLPMYVIITTGTQRNYDTLNLGALPTNVIVKPWIAHSDLLPLTDILVTHGGGGTVVAALSAGVPMVVVPLMWDQPENAQRVVYSGAGLSLSPRKCTPGRLREAVKQVLRDPWYRQNAEQLAMCLRRYGGASQAAELLESIVPR